ncbi:nicotinate-nucleotide diphosphorylase (carboxylating) [Blastopirellula marina]|uniref:Probable nicotinate-nucleotide pyrophosphorylase [carboxylating] n=1 Tax=Blastopirellula marina TaxID=124 RepID=A0A2S8F1D6_9BACT|nr:MULTISPECIES: carboxylating nicotinate-nucleotide diphosphorylase [Pirellulaceae]PQO25981.1 nicotinate-nucleotide diphosphorylase (carboxylating) [Blastopirellula marina]RCS44339.1 carboxylating nicotinate-nucleotide diphosphorylase [Bremerella cremea]
MAKQFHQVAWDDLLQDDSRQLLDLAVREDLGREHDWSTLSLIPESATGEVRIVARQEGVLAGSRIIDLMIDELELDIEATYHHSDRSAMQPGDKLITLGGSVRDLLTTERIVLNFLGRLVGVATLTRTYVEQVQGTAAQVYDTRKTTPGWRRLEKYAVQCGGGTNHRTGLYEAVMLKDNHLAWYTQFTGKSAQLGDLVGIVRQFLIDQLGETNGARRIIEIEVDRIEQLQQVLPSKPDIILLDNMNCETLRAAVELRNQLAPEVELEASGGVNLQTIRGIAETGVERISVGALTHSAVNVDLGYDWG